MQMRGSRCAILLLSIIFVFVLLLAILLFETAFFHLNPIKFGYVRFDFGRYIVFSKSKTIDSEYRDVLAIMLQNESSHGLHYNSKVQIILCEKQTDIDRFQPFVDAVDRRNAGSFAPWPNTIYITPRIKERYGSIHGALAHELSHILLIQNYGLMKTYRLWKLQEWIPEGFSTYFANWPNYFPRDKLASNMMEAGIELPNSRLLGAKQKAEVPLPLRFMIYRYFVEYLFQRNTPATVILFLRKACDNPKEVEPIFQDQFGDSLVDYVKTFSVELSP